MCFPSQVRVRRMSGKSRARQVGEQQQGTPRVSASNSSSGYFSHLQAIITLVQDVVEFHYVYLNVLWPGYGKASPINKGRANASSRHH